MLEDACVHGPRESQEDGCRALDRSHASATLPCVRIAWAVDQVHSWGPRACVCHRLLGGADVAVNVTLALLWPQGSTARLPNAAATGRLGPPNL